LFCRARRFPAVDVPYIPVRSTPVYKIFWQVILFCLFLHPLAAQVMQIATTETFLLARSQRKPILLVFSGSDWCQPCIRFNKTVLNDSTFARFARKQLLVVNADFPQRKKLPDSVIKINESLAARYNPDGSFPRIVLLRPDETVITTIAYNNQKPSLFIEQLTQSLHEANMLKEYTIQSKLMGSMFGFVVCARNETEGHHWLNMAIGETRRIEELLSEFKETSQVAAINRNAGIAAAVVDREVFDLIQRSNDISRLSAGAFDITAGSLKKLYNFKGETIELPSKKLIQQTLEKTSYQKIQLTAPDKIFLPIAAMRISFAAIGKGYAADKVKKLLLDNGVEAGVVNASGDLTAWGNRPGGQPWKAGIADPEDPNRMIAWLPLNNLSVATSGNYIQYFESAGKKYSHNIDPRTGYPVQGIKSVSVVSPGAELSDALATATTVMGVRDGIDFINQLPQTHCIIIDEHNQVHTSAKLNMRSDA
jgi:FAD:protein FMN transferase